MKFKVGDKVVPISKSIGVTFDMCGQIRRMKEFKHKFLYVTFVMEISNCYTCCCTTNYGGNDFLESDLVLYEGDSLFDDLNDTL